MPASNEFHTYSFEEVILVVLGRRITGFQKGTSIKVKRDNDTFSDEAGGDGAVVRIKNLDQRGDIEFTLMQTASDNDYLYGLVATDEAVLGGVGAVGASSLKHLGGSSLHDADKSWVQKPADAEWGPEAYGVTWKVRCAKLRMKGGGSVL